MTHHGKSGHVGSMLSMAEILAVLYERILKVDPANPKRPDRDRLILSKGHGGGAVYAALAEKGFFPKDWLMTYYCDEGKLMGHISHYVPGVEFSTGSLDTDCRSQWEWRLRPDIAARSKGISA